MRWYKYFWKPAKAREISSGRPRGINAVLKEYVRHQKQVASTRKKAKRGLRRTGS